MVDSRLEDPSFNLWRGLEADADQPAHFLDCVRLTLRNVGFFWRSKTKDGLDPLSQWIRLRVSR